MEQRGGHTRRGASSVGQDFELRVVDAVDLDLLGPRSTAGAADDLERDAETAGAERAAGGRFRDASR